MTNTPFDKIVKNRSKIDRFLHIIGKIDKKHRCFCNKMSKGTCKVRKKVVY